MRISLIVTTYNRPDALMLVLKSIQIQSLKPTEVIIADDGSNNDTKKINGNINIMCLISSYKATFLNIKINIIRIGVISIVK